MWFILFHSTQIADIKTPELYDSDPDNTSLCHYHYQCCGFGAFLSPGAGIRDGQKIHIRDPGRNPGYYLRELVISFLGKKYLNYFMQIWIWSTLDPGFGMEEFLFEIRIRNTCDNTEISFSCFYKLPKFALKSDKMHRKSVILTFKHLFMMPFHEGDKTVNKYGIMSQIRIRYSGLRS